MTSSQNSPFARVHRTPRLPWAGAVLLFAAAGCGAPAAATPDAAAVNPIPANVPTVDPRIGLDAGLSNAGEAIWNLRLVSATTPADDFVGITNSDLAFLGDYAIQGNYNGFQVWDISNPASPSLVRGYLCPASQSDVSVYQNLLFVSGEGFEGRLDCGTDGNMGAVSADRLRGIRIFDISDIRNPEYIGNVQTCRGSHTHSLLVDPDDTENVYVYVSGSAPVRSDRELPGCSAEDPAADPSSALFRIEVIRVPLDDPGSAAIVSSPRIFEDLVAPPRHGLAPDDMAEIDAARRRGAFVVEIDGEPYVLSNGESDQLLSQIVAARGGTGPATTADSVMLREALPFLAQQLSGSPEAGPDQCHDITLYPEIGRAGGACEGYGLLIDITDPENPTRLAATSDVNFSYWHSATFNNEGTKVLFTDEWGGGREAKCRATDPVEWGADAIFTIEGEALVFQSYYKLPAPQTPEENCVAHNGSLLPIPGRDVMVQSWYQGGISVFDWTDPRNPTEIAYFDRGPVDANEVAMGGSWSAYWYNGVIVSSEIARGLDIFELTPSEHISQNEIDAALTVRFDYLNPQGQQRYTFPASASLAKAYVDQLARSGGLSADRIAWVRQEIAAAEAATGPGGTARLAEVAAELGSVANRSTDPVKVGMLVQALRDLAAVDAESGGTDLGRAEDASGEAGR
jgi:hypothetical protein